MPTHWSKAPRQHYREETETLNHPFRHSRSKRQLHSATEQLNYPFAFYYRNGNNPLLCVTTHLNVVANLAGNTCSSTGPRETCRVASSIFVEDVQSRV